MFEALSILAAVIFLILTLQIRAALALSFPVRSVRLVEGPGPEEADDLRVFEQPAAELAALGFEGPLWIETVTQLPANNSRIVCLRRPADGTLAFLAPSFVPEVPNHGQYNFVTRLADGRTCVTQPSDPYYKLVCDPTDPVQMIKLADCATMIAAHQTLVAHHGRPAAEATSELTILDLCGRWHNNQRISLLRRKKIAIAGDGIARPRLGFALALIWNVLKRPKPPIAKDEITPGRLAQIARTIRRTRDEQAPAPAVQFWLFLVSVLLFMAVGAYFFEWHFALILLVVITAHEAGHYLAMRAFGYRNVTMLALPLVGGVTVGHEDSPRALHRAWMSLAGPLPGIIVGWILVFWFLASGTPVDFSEQSFAWQLALTALVLNYLNVLPVLPLDGGHIVQAILPARWYGLRILFLVGSCLLGLVAAAVFGFIGLGIVIAFQLFQIPRLLESRRALARLLPGHRLETPRNELMNRALAELHAVAGPARQPLPRIAQATDLVRSLEVVPMGWVARLLTTAVYLGLTIVPIVAVVFVLLFGALFGGVEKIGEMAEEQQALEAEADALSFEERVVKLAGADLPLPAPRAALDMAETRLGIKFPAELQTLYSRVDGLPKLGLLPVGQVVKARSSTIFAKLPSEGVVVYGGVEEQTVGPEAMRDWLYLGSNNGELFYDIAVEPALAGHRVITIQDETFASSLPDLATWSRELYIVEISARAFDERLRTEFARLGAADWPGLLAAFESPNPILGWLTSLSLDPAKPPAAEDEVADLEARMGRSLPEDLKQLYRIQNGVLWFDLAPVSAIEKLKIPERPLLNPFQAALKRVDAQGRVEEGLLLEPSELAGCWSLSSPSEGLPGWPSLLLCSDLESRGAVIIEPYQASAYSDFRTFVRWKAAQAKAFQ